VRGAVLLIPLVLLAARPALPQGAQAQSQLDSSEVIFTVLAAINAAGYDDQIDSTSNSPLRQSVRQKLAALDLDSVRALKRFFRDHRQKTPAAELGQYISYALQLDGPPYFGNRYRNQQWPPDAEALQDLTPLLAAFYKEAHISDLWEQSEPAFDQAMTQYHEPVARAILQATTYLRNISNGSLGRQFQIYVDLLGAPNQVQSRTYGDDYFVVVTPTPELPIQAIRHQYLHYLVDTLALKFSAAVNKKKALADYAKGAPLLESFYKSDFYSLTTECLIKAIESRLDRNPEMATQAMREGYILTPAIAEQLAIYEKQDQAMRLYFPDLIAAIDLAREEKRMASLEFSTERAQRKIVTVAPVKQPELTGAAKLLDGAENAYLSRDLKTAKEGFTRLLEQPGEKSMHAKSYYGLARIAVLERDPELSDRLFRKVLEMDPDASTKSWSLLYLGRLADAQGDRAQAEENYKAALAVEGAPDVVRESAEKGLQQAFRKN